MSVTRLYYCDLCRANGDGEPLRGIYWKREATKEQIEFRPFREVEHHICEKCLSDLARLAHQTGERL